MSLKEDSKYQQLSPCTPLNDFVDLYWESVNFSSKSLKRTIFPDSFFKLVVTLVNNKISVVFLTGLWTTENEIVIPGNATIYGIKFKIIAPEYVFQKEIASILDSQKILDPSFWGIEDMNLTSLQNFVDQIEPVISKKLNKNKEIQNKKLIFSKLLYSSKGNILVKEISKKVNWSSRSINRYYTKYLGVSLKTYLNIQKIYVAYFPIINKEFFPEKGFYDQSHFIREVKKHTANTPKELESLKENKFIQLKNIEKKRD